MCQFAIIRAGATPAQQRQSREAAAVCRCHCNGNGAATAAATPGVSESAEELRRLPAQLAARYFAAPTPVDPSQYSPALAAELRWPDANASTSTVSKSSSPEAVGAGKDDAKVVGGLKPAMRSEPQGGRRVRFADELGRALTQVRLIEPHRVSSWQRSPPAELSEPAGCCSGRSLRCRNFQQPTADRALSAIGAGAARVQLSGLRLDPDGLRVHGFALVANLHYRKRVFVRVTFNAWRSSSDIGAAFAGSLDDQRDAFAFGFGCPAEVDAFEFCVGFEASGERHWDNNRGGNYQVGLLPPPPPSRPVFCIGDVDDDEED